MEKYAVVILALDEGVDIASVRLPQGNVAAIKIMLPASTDRRIEELQAALGQRHGQPSLGVHGIPTWEL
jgi:hypothetical protein